MDYVIITAILTFFVLLFFVKNKEGYTDSYINSGIESLKKTNENISKTVITIKNFTGTNVGSTEVKIDVLDALEQLNESLKVNSTTTPISSEILTKIELQKNNLNGVQDNFIKINKKLKEVLAPVYVSIIRLNEIKPKMVPLLTALNIVSEDITTINNNLQTLPDK